MPPRQFITLRARNTNEEIDIELPGDQPVASLMADLLKVLNWPSSSNGINLKYSLVTEDGTTLPGGTSLKAAGIESFDVLWIELDAEQLGPDEGQPASEAPLAGLERRPASPAEDSAGSLPPPIWARIPIDAPCLVSAEGIVFMLGQTPITIGRRSQDKRPDIDLTELDSDYVASRFHAEIRRTQDRFILHALNTKNGTLVNGNELRADEDWPLRDGDLLRFGFRGVQLTFRLPRGYQGPGQTDELKGEAYLQGAGGARFVLLNATTTIGRSSGGKVDYDLSAIDNPKQPIISRNHASILREADNYFICDNHSGNGTFLNGEQLKPEVKYSLKSGDVIELGLEDYGGVKLQFMRS